MTDFDKVRQTLLTCLWDSLPRYTPDGLPTVLDPHSGEGLWHDAILPYNLRLADSVGPLALVYPQTPGAIGAAIHCAKASNVPAVPRSGGHSYGAYSLGGSLNPSSSSSSSSSSNRPYPPPITPDTPIPAEPSLIIDMRAFRTVNYNFHEQTVQVGAGTLLGEMSTVLEKVGRMIPSGSCPTVGVGGQAVSGGFGLMSRSQGLLLDNMLSAEVVLADGQSVTVSSVRRPDLYWGIRGGGSSLGIAHSFVFRTHPAPDTVVYYELALLPRALPSTEEAAERATGLFRAFQEFGRRAPAKLGMSWHVTPEPDGKGGYGTKVEVLGQWMGTEEEYEVVMQDFEALVKSKDAGEFQRGQRSLTYLQSMHNVGGNWTALPERGPLNINEHVYFYAKSLLTKREISRPAISAHMTYLLSLSPRVNPSSNVEWFVLSPYLGGMHSAVTRRGDTAFGHRDLMIVWELYAKKIDDHKSTQGVDLVSFVKRMSSDLTPVHAVYPAYVDPELTASEYPRLVWGDTYPRLQSLKQRYDPSNVFRFPQSIRANSSFPWSTLWIVFVGSAILFWLIRHYRRRRQTLKTRRE